MSDELHSPKNYPGKTTELYAFVSVDEHGEGLIAKSMPTPNGVMMMPFVSASKEIAESLRPIAIEMAKEHNKKIKFIRFSVREELEDIG